MRTPKQKATAYLTPELSADLNDMVSISGLSVSSFLERLIATEAEKNAEKIAKLRELRECDGLN